MRPMDHCVNEPAGNPSHTGLCIRVGNARNTRPASRLMAMNPRATLRRTRASRTMNSGTTATE